MKRGRPHLAGGWRVCTKCIITPATPMLIAKALPALLPTRRWQRCAAVRVCVRAFVCRSARALYMHTDTYFIHVRCCGGGIMKIVVQQAFAPIRARRRRNEMMNTKQNPCPGSVNSAWHQYACLRIMLQRNLPHGVCMESRQRTNGGGGGFGALAVGSHQQHIARKTQTKSNQQTTQPTR